MNSLFHIIRKMRDSTLPPTPIPLDSVTRPKFKSWEFGFNAYEPEGSIETALAPLPFRSRALARQGWEAAKRVDELLVIYGPPKTW